MPVCVIVFNDRPAIFYLLSFIFYLYLFISFLLTRFFCLSYSVSSVISPAATAAAAAATEAAAAAGGRAMPSES